MAEETPWVSIEITEQEGKWDKTNVYKPLLKVMPLIIKGLKEKDIWIPLSEIARLEIQGKMEDFRHELLRAQVVHFLKRSNRYKKTYFKIMEKSRANFERTMKKQGLYQPQMKEFRSLSVALPAALIFSKDRKTWIYSFNEYLPEILYRSDSKKSKSNDGEEVLGMLIDSVSRELDEMEKFRKISLKFAKILKADLKLASKSPTLPFRSWHKDTKNKDSLDGIYYFKYKVKSAPKADEVEI